MAAAKKQWITGVDNTVIILGGLGIVAGGTYLILKTKGIKIFGSGASEQATAVEIPATTATAASTPKANTPAVVTLNKDLVLKKGSQGGEVKQLQTLLGFTGTTIDGDFGNDTEAALKAKKGVIQISINGFNATTSVNPTPYKIGDRLQANAKPDTKLYDATQDAKGGYFTNSEIQGSVTYGKEIGKIIAVSAKGNSYVVAVPGVLYGTNNYFVNHAFVTKI